MWVPLKKNKQKKSKGKKADGGMRQRSEERVFLFFFSLSFFLRFTKIRPSDFVGINTKSALHDEGYAWVPKTRDFNDNSGKNSKNPKFFVFLRFTTF